VFCITAFEASSCPLCALEKHLLRVEDFLVEVNGRGEIAQQEKNNDLYCVHQVD
jgi:hypothetical protein